MYEKEQPSCYFRSIKITGTVNFNLDLSYKGTDNENKIDTPFEPINTCTIVTANKNDLYTFASLIRVISDIENSDDEDSLVNQNREIFIAIIQYSHYNKTYEYYVNVQMTEVLEVKCYELHEDGTRTLLYDRDNHQPKDMLKNTFKDFTSNYINAPLIQPPVTYHAYSKGFYEEIAEWIYDWNSDSSLIDLFLSALCILVPEYSNIDDVKVTRNRQTGSTIYFHADKEYKLEDFPVEFIYAVQLIRYYFCTVETQAPLLFNNLDEVLSGMSAYKRLLLKKFIIMMMHPNTNKHQSQCLFFVSNQMATNLLTIDTGVAVIKIT